MFILRWPISLIMLVKVKFIFLKIHYWKMECLNYLIDNSYVTYQGKIYGQVIGLPMGTNAALQIANAYLHAMLLNTYFLLILY